MNTDRPGPLAGVRVAEIASDHTAFAGKLLGDLGADVVVIEPPGGHASRGYEPFQGDEPGQNRSLWWWHYNTSKRGVTVDFERDPTLAIRLLRAADVVIEGEPPGRLQRLGLSYADVAAGARELVWVSVTPFGQAGPRHDEVATDLTVLAAGGPLWSCGYDDHQLPPVRGGGNQGYQTAGLHAVVSALVALVHARNTGHGQFVDVSMHAAANVTTEAATYEWLIARRTVQRQTARHAMPRPAPDTLLTAVDGRHVQYTMPPHTERELRALLDWVDVMGGGDPFPGRELLAEGVRRGGVRFSDLRRDPVVAQIVEAGRDALRYLAGRLPAYELFVGGQQRGIPLGIIYAPEEALTDAHMVARRWVRDVDHGDGSVHRYPGPPFRAPSTPWRISRRAPQLGEHDAEVVGEWLASEGWSR